MTPNNIPKGTVAEWCGVAKQLKLTTPDGVTWILNKTGDGYERLQPDTTIPATP